MTIDQAAGQTDPTGASAINFTVIFSEPVTGFSSEDVTITGTAGATTAVVTGSGTTYNVAVSGMAGAGTVLANVSAGAAEDSVHNTSAASTSSDNLVNYDGRPRNLSMTPHNGTLTTTPFTLRSVYRDLTGFADIKKAYLLINDSLGQANAVLALYDRSTNRVYLKNDANSSWGTGYTPGTSITLQNSQCYLYVGVTTVSGSGNDLTINWRIALKSPFSAKPLNAYMYVQDFGGLTDGWEQMGVYHAVKPQVVSVNPSSDSLPIDTATTFTSLYRDPNGFDDIRRCYLLIDESLDQADAVFLYYDRPTNKIYLKNDANTSWGTGYAPGTAVTLSNSQCEVYVGSTTTYTNEDDLTVTWSVKLKPSMADKNLYSWMFCSDMAALSGGWKKMGTHFTPIAPTAVSVAPSGGSVVTGMPQPFTAQYSDENGYANLSQCYLQIGQTGSLANSVFVLYDAKQGKVFLRNDANTSWGTGYAPGSAIVLENSQCKLHVQDSSTIYSGSDDLYINLSIELNPILATKLLGERMFCRDNEWLNSGWKLKGYVRAE